MTNKMFIKTVLMTVSFILFTSVFLQSCSLKDEVKTTKNKGIMSEENKTKDFTQPDSNPENQEISVLENFIDEKTISSENISTTNIPEKTISDNSSSDLAITDNEYFYLNEDGEMITFEMPVKTNLEIKNIENTKEVISSPDFVTENQESNLVSVTSNTEKEIISTIKADTVYTDITNINSKRIPSHTQATSENTNKVIVIKDNSLKQPKATSEKIVKQTSGKINTSIKKEANNYSLEKTESVYKNSEPEKNNTNTVALKSNASPKKNTSSLVIINGTPLESNDDFKEMKISDIESVTVVKENHLDNWEGENEQNMIVINTKDSSLKTTKNRKPIIINNSTLKTTSNNLEYKTVKIPDNNNTEIIRLYNSQKPLGDVDIALTTITSFNEEKKPLYIIDGTRIETTDLFTIILTQVNPSEIESISFIKGSSATPLYGNKATEGAVLINTKSGNAIKKVQKKIPEKLENNQKSNTTSPLVKL